MKLIQEVGKGDRVARVKYCPHDEEYVVKFYIDGRIQLGGDYFTEFKADAIGAAKSWCSQAEGAHHA